MTEQNRIRADSQLPEVQLSELLLAADVFGGTGEEQVKQQGSYSLGNAVLIYFLFCNHYHGKFQAYTKTERLL